MLSVIVNFFNMQREAKNTLLSLTQSYTGAADYEVIAVDNGSTAPLPEEFVKSLGPEFQYQFVETRSISPVEAINRAAREARGEQLIILIDGAHMLSPGILPSVQKSFVLFEHAFVATVALHLGPRRQDISASEGYTTQVEDQLLAQCGWRENGYRLFTVANALADASMGWFGCLFESNCFAIRRDDFLAMGGFDERFQTRGGGLANLDFFRRALLQSRLEYIMLLGEATFHQIHGTMTTSDEDRKNRFDEYAREYEQIRGDKFQRIERRPVYFGSIASEALAWHHKSAADALPVWIQSELRAS